MEIILSNIIQIKEPTKEIIDYCKTKLTFTNPDYSKKMQMGLWLGRIPKYIKLYDIYEEDVYLPIGCFTDIYKMYPNPSLYHDYSVVVPRKIESSINLRDYQKPCLNALKKHVNGILVLPCGLGKTECALQIASYLGQKTLFITHTNDLVNQAHDRCVEKIKCSTSFIKAGTVDTSGDITFATVQTLFKNLDKINQNEFGLVITDECFPAETKILTPSGYKNIEDIKIGDEIFTYNHESNKYEIEKVTYLFNKTVKSDTLLKITHSTGSFECTPNHPIYTNRGYIRADEIREGDILYEMQLLSSRNNKRKLHKKPMVLQDELSTKNESNILLTKLCKKGCCGKFKPICSYGCCNEQNAIQQSFKKRRCTNESIRYIEKDRSQTKNTRWKWSWFNKTTTYFSRIIRNNRFKCENGISNSNENEKRFGLSVMLQGRHWNREFENCYRSRWGFSLSDNKTTTRQEKRRVLKKSRVESVEVQKSRNIRESSKSYEGVKVYNIGVDKNHNYFANDILVHNCHHVASNADSVCMFRSCIDYFAARYKLGLTATLHRADGLQGCIPKIIGDVIYEIMQDGDDYVGIYEGKEILRFPTNQFQVPAEVIFTDTGYSLYDNKHDCYRDVFDKSGMTISYAKLINDISMNTERNKLIIDICNKTKGSTIILSDRVEQLKYLHEYIKDSVEIDGKTNKKLREKALENIKNGKYRVLLASYPLAKEGLDCKILQNVIFATPIKDEAIVIQCIGRAQRTYPGKTKAYVYDLVDDVSMFTKFVTKRRGIYKRKGWYKK